MPLTRAAQIPSMEVYGSTLQLVASPANGATESVVMRGIVPAGGTFPPHKHDREEVLFFASGACRYTIGDEVGEAAAGDVFVIPANTLHVFEAIEQLDGIGVLPAGAKTFAEDGSEISFGG